MQLFGWIIKIGAGLALLGLLLGLLGVFLLGGMLFSHYFLDNGQSGSPEITDCRSKNDCRRPVQFLV